MPIYICSRVRGHHPPPPPNGIPPPPPPPPHDPTPAAPPSRSCCADLPLLRIGAKRNLCSSSFPHQDMNYNCLIWRVVCDGDGGSCSLMVLMMKMTTTMMMFSMMSKMIRLSTRVAV